MERNVRLLVCYDGTGFRGWQSQPGLRTVQGTLEDSLRRVLRHPFKLVASGRTDAGVHAVGQVANVVTSCDIPDNRLRHAVGARLPADVGVRAVDTVSMRFHATHSAVSKLYRYRIHNVSERPVAAFTQRYTHHFWVPLDVEAMHEAARHFVGTMDFTSMTPASCERETTVRTVFRCDVVRHLDEIRVDVKGSGFLYNQVRNMVGTLIEIGRGHWAPERVPAILEARDRSQAGPTAPALGLCLQWVRYPAELLRPEGEGGAAFASSTGNATREGESDTPES
jgi:tRNA pseudouridine38-40 synthase